MICPKCNSVMPNGTKFCTNCGTKLQNTFFQPIKVEYGTDNHNTISTTKQSILDEHHLELGANMHSVAQWSIGQNEIARRISEIDFVNIGTISSIIIQPGVTAIIYIDGKEVLQLNSGVYRFLSDEEVAQAIQSCQTTNSNNTPESKGITGWLKTKLKSLIKLFCSKKNNEQPDNVTDRRPNIPEILSRLNEKSLIAIYLKRDINFPAIFGTTETSNGKRTFAPMNIRTKMFDAQIGVHLFLKINDFHSFIGAYLANRKFVTTSDIQDDLSIYVYNVLQEELKYEEINDFGISENAKSRICSRFQEIARFAPGVEFVRLAEISCSNEAIDRFRKLSQELYCNEKELDFLHRTNEFKNRLARENNAVAIANARNDAELENALRAINRDKLLNDEEFDAFKDALKIRKLGRDANLATASIKTREAIKQTDSEAKTSTILKELENQERISEMVYAKMLRELQFQKEKKREEREIRREEKRAEIDLRKEEDAYSDEREKHRLDTQRHQLDMAMEIRERMARQEHDNKDRDHAREQDALHREHLRELEKVAQKREIQKDHYAHTEAMANIRKEYTAEQMTAENLASLDANAQVEFAKSLGYRKEEEIAKIKQQMFDDYMRSAREEREMIYQKSIEDKNSLFEFAKEAMRMTAAAAGAQVSNAETLSNKYKADADRYREDVYYQQSRIDYTQDKALDYTTRVTTAEIHSEKEENTTPLVKHEIIYCPYCNAQNDSENTICDECGYNLK